VGVAFVAHLLRLLKHAALSASLRHAPYVCTSSSTGRRTATTQHHDRVVTRKDLLTVHALLLARTPLLLPRGKLTHNGIAEMRSVLETCTLRRWAFLRSLRRVSYATWRFARRFLCCACTATNQTLNDSNKIMAIACTHDVHRAATIHSSACTHGLGVTQCKASSLTPHIA